VRERFHRITRETIVSEVKSTGEQPARSALVYHRRVLIRAGTVKFRRHRIGNTKYEINSYNYRISMAIAT